MTIDPSQPVDADLMRLVDDVYEDALVAVGIRIPGALKNVFGGKRRKYIEAEWIRDRLGRWVKYIGVPWKDFWKKNGAGREVPQFAYGGIYRSPFYGDQVNAGNIDRAAYVARIASPRLEDGTVLIEVANRLTDLGRRPDPAEETWETIGSKLPEQVPGNGSAFIRRPLGEDNNTFELTSKGRAVLEFTGPERRADLSGDSAQGVEDLDALDVPTTPERGAGFDDMGYTPLEYDPADRQWQQRYSDHVIKAYQDYLKYLDRLGLGSDAAKFSDFLANAARVLRERMGRETRIQVPAKTLGSIIKSGALKTQFETKSSMGLYGPDIRKESELELLGIPEDLPDHLRPVYGYLFQEGEKNRADRYGELMFILVDPTKARTTVTGEDSLAKLSPATLRASLLEDAPMESVLMAVSSSVLMRAALHAEGLIQPFRYHEAQIHGGLPLQEVTQILVDEKDLTNSPGIRTTTLQGILDREGATKTLQMVFGRLGLPVESGQFETAVRDVESGGDVVAAVEKAVNGFLLDSGNSLTKFSVNRGSDQGSVDSLDALDIGWDEDENGDLYDEIGIGDEDFASLLEGIEDETFDEILSPYSGEEDEPRPVEPLPDYINNLKKDFDTEVGQALLPYGLSVKTDFEKQDEKIFGVEGKILDAEGKVVGVFKREIFDDFVANEDFRLKKSMQGQGIGKKLTEAMNKAYLKNGYNTVRIFNANEDVGGYAWAKIGFDYDWGPDPLKFARDVDTDRMFEIAQGLFTGTADYDPDEIISYNTPNGIIHDPIGLTGKALDLLQKIRKDDPDLADDLEQQFHSYIKRLYNPDPDPTKRVTPIELAKIGYTEGASNWFGKELLTGETSGWQGVMDIRKQKSLSTPVARLPETEQQEETIDALDIEDLNDAPRGAGWETLGYQPKEFNPDNPGDRNNYQSLMDAVLTGFKFRTTEIPEELATKEGLAEYIAQAVRDQLSGPIVVAAPRNVLGSIISGGAVKSQFETSASRGMLDRDFRRTVEFGLMGVPTDLPDHLRPIYGYISKPYPIPWVKEYGELEITVADTVSQRTTVTLGDSLAEQPARVLRWDRVGDAPVESLLSTGSIQGLVSIAQKRLEGEIYTDYSEVQINGGLPLKDIKEITIKQLDISLNDREILIDPEKELSGLLRSWGIRPGKKELEEAAATIKDRSTMLDAVERLINNAIKRAGSTAVFRIDRGRAELRDADIDALDIDDFPDENPEIIKHALFGDLNEAYIAVMQINNEKLLTDLALKAKHEAIREIAAGRVTDNEFLAEIAKGTRRAVIADTAIEKVTDQSLLQDIAYSAKTPAARWKAVRMMTDEGQLEHLAKWSDDPSVRAEALRKIDDQSILEDALLNASDVLPRLVAAERVQDQNVLKSILGQWNTNSELSAAVIKRLDDQQVLASVAVDDGYDRQSRLNAIDSLNDQRVLESLMFDENESRAIRIAAAKRVQDEEALKNFLGNFKKYWSSDLDEISKKINDRDFWLGKALAGESSPGLRTAAVDALEDDEDLLRVLGALNPSDYSNNAPIEQALMKLKDKKKAYEFFTRGEFVYQYAVASSMNDPDFIRVMLNDISKNPDKKSQLQIAAALLDNISDQFPNQVGQQILHNFIQDNEDTSSVNLRKIVENAVSKMTDQQLLDDLLKGTDKQNLQNVLLRQVTDPNVLGNFVLSNNDDFTRSRQLDLIADVAVLERLVRDAPDGPVKDAIEFRLQELLVVEPIYNGIIEAIEKVFDNKNWTIKKKKSFVLGMDYSSLNLEVEIFDENGKRVAYIHRAIDGRNMEIDNAHFQVEKDYQKGGRGKKLTKILDKFYSENGITALRTIANMDVGTYTWTRLGFDFDWKNNFDDMFDADEDFEGYAKRKIEKEVSDQTITKEEGGELKRRLKQLMKAAKDPDIANRPVPEDFALLGYVPGATDWFGKRLLIDGAKEIKLSWMGIKPISPVENTLKQVVDDDLDAIDVPSPVEEVLLSNSMLRAAADAADQFDAPDDWEVNQLGEGSSDPALWRNPTTGERMVVKVGIDGEYEQLEAEVLASKFLRGAGFTAAPDAQINDYGTVVVLSHVDDAFPGGEPATTWVKLTPEQRLAAVNDFSDPRVGIRMLLADIAMVNIDRHGGNVMIARDAQGVAHLVPIDNSEAKTSDVHKSSESFDEYYKNILKEAGHANLQIFNLSAERIFNYFLNEYGNDEQQAFARIRGFFEDEIGFIIEDAWSGGFDTPMEQALSENLDYMRRDRDHIVNTLFGDFRESLLNERTPQAKLKDVAVNDPEARYRAAAALHLHDQIILEQLIANDPDESVRQAAVTNITNQVSRSGYALNDRDPGVRRNATEGIDDQDLLKTIATNDMDEQVRIAAILNIDDQNFLLDRLQKSKSQSESIVIANNITDENILEKIVRNFRSPSPSTESFVIATAFRGIKNKNLLQAMADDKSLDRSIRESAARRINAIKNQRPTTDDIDAIDVPDSIDSPSVREIFLEDSQLKAVERAVDPSDAPQEWQAILLGEGQSQPAEWRNPATGERMIVKKGINDPYLDLEKEVIATEVLRRAGITATPAAAVNEAGTVAVISHIDDLFPDGPRAANWGRLTHMERYDVVAEMSDPLDGLRIMIADIALRNTDRHPQNLMMKRDPAGRPFVVPIDHGNILQYPYDSTFSGADRFVEAQPLYFANVELFGMVMQRLQRERMVTNGDNPIEAAQYVKSLLEEEFDYIVHVMFRSSVEVDSFRSDDQKLDFQDTLDILFENLQHMNDEPGRVVTALMDLYRRWETSTSNRYEQWQEARRNKSLVVAEASPVSPEDNDLDAIDISMEDNDVDDAAISNARAEARAMKEELFPGGVFQSTGDQYGNGPDRLRTNGRIDEMLNVLFEPGNEKAWEIFNKMIPLMKQELLYRWGVSPTSDVSPIEAFNMLWPKAMLGALNHQGPLSMFGPLPFPAGKDRDSGVMDMLDDLQRRLYRAENKNDNKYEELVDALEEFINWRDFEDPEFVLQLREVSEDLSTAFDGDVAAWAKELNAIADAIETVPVEAVDQGRGIDSYAAYLEDAGWEPVARNGNRAWISPDGRWEGEYVPEPNNIPNPIFVLRNNETGRSESFSLYKDEYDEEPGIFTVKDFAYELNALRSAEYGVPEDDYEAAKRVALSEILYRPLPEPVVPPQQTPQPPLHMWNTVDPLELDDNELERFTSPDGTWSFSKNVEGAGSLINNRTGERYRISSALSGSDDDTITANLIRNTESADDSIDAIDVPTPAPQEPRLYTPSYPTIQGGELESLVNADGTVDMAALQDFLKGKELVGLDFETTGLSVTSRWPRGGEDGGPLDRPTQVALVPFRDGQPVDDPTGRLVTLLNPHKPIPPIVTRLTGIDDPQVADQRSWADALPDIIRTIGDRILVAQNASFDVEAIRDMIDTVQNPARVGELPPGVDVERLRRELNDLGATSKEWLPPGGVIDTKPMAGHVFGRLKERGPDDPVNDRLVTLSKHFGIPHENAHDALSDIEATIGVLGKLLDVGAARDASFDRAEQVRRFEEGDAAWPEQLERFRQKMARYREDLAAWQEQDSLDAIDVPFDSPLDDLPILDELPQSLEPTRKFGLHQNPDGTIVLRKPRDILSPENDEPDQPLQYVYRSISEEEWEQIKQTGQLMSDGRMNLDPSEGTVTKGYDPTWYLPHRPGLRGRTIRIQYDPADGWRLDVDGYIKTNQPVPADRIDAVTDWTYGTGSNSLPLREAVESIPDDIHYPIDSALGRASAEADRDRDWQRQDQFDEWRRKLGELQRDMRRKLRDEEFNRLTPSLEQVEEYLDSIEREIPAEFSGDVVAAARAMVAQLRAEQESDGLDAIDIPEDFDYSSLTLSDIQLINDPVALAAVADNALTTQLRKAAVARITDQQVLIDLISSTVHFDTMRAAIARFVNEQALAKLAKSFDNPLLQAAVIYNMTDESLLRGLLDEVEDPQVKFLIVNKINDQNILLDLVVNSVDDDVLEDVLRKVQDQRVLFDVAVDPSSDEIGSAALENIDDPDLLRRLVNNSSNPVVVEQAADKIRFQEEMEKLRGEIEEQLRDSENSENDENENYSDEDEGELADQIDEFVISVIDEAEVAISEVAERYGLEAIPDEQFKIDQYAYEFSFTLYNEEGDEVGRMKRAIDGKNLYIENSWFAINKSRQGKGFGSAVTKALEEVYRKNGIKKIILNANIDVGAYAWARQGFKFDWERTFGNVPFKTSNGDFSDYADKKLQQMVREGRLTQEEAEELDKKFTELMETLEWHGSNSNVEPIDFALLGYDESKDIEAEDYTWFGKELLIGAGKDLKLSWNGVKNLETTDNDIDAIDVPDESVESTAVTSRMQQAAADAADPSDVPTGWQGQRTATGASEPYIWTDPETGQRMIVKKSLNGKYPPLEKELIGAQALRGIGLNDTPEALVNENGTVVMVRHAGDQYPEGDPPKEWARLTPQEKAEVGARLADPWDAIRLLLGDVLLANEDRNPGNLLIGPDDDGRLRLYPIDHGSTLRRAYVPEEQFDPSFSREPGGAAYDTSRASPQGYIRNRRSRHGQISHDLARIVLDSIYQGHLEQSGGDAVKAKERFETDVAERVAAIIEQLGDMWFVAGDRVYTAEQQAIREGTMQRMLANIALVQQQQAGIVVALIDLFNERQSWPGWAEIFGGVLRGSGNDRRSRQMVPGVEDVLGVTDSGGIVVVSGFPSGGGGVRTVDGGEEGVVISGHPVFEVHLPSVFDHGDVVRTAEDGPGRWVVLVGDDRDKWDTCSQ